MCNYIITIIQFSNQRKRIDSFKGNNNISNEKELNGSSSYLQMYNSLSLIEKITMKNKVNKIISAYKIFAKRKNVSIYNNKYLKE